MRAYLKFKDRGGIESLCWMRNLVTSCTLAQVQAFANAMITNALTNAGIVEYGLIRLTSFSLDDGNPSSGSCVKNKARCHFNYINANGETVPIALWIPAPDMAMFEYIEGVGYRMVPLSGQAIRDGLRAMTGVSTIEFITGILDYSEAEQGARSDNAIEFEDADFNRCWMSVPQPVSMAALQTFAELITGESIASVRRGVYATPEVTVVPDTDPMSVPMSDDNGFDSVERRCTCKFAYVQGTRRKFMLLNVPAPRSVNLVSGKDKPGYALAKASGDALAAAITALYGAGNRTVSFRSGRVKKTELDNQ